MLDAGLSAELERAGVAVSGRLWSARLLPARRGGGSGAGGRLGAGCWRVGPQQVGELADLLGG